MKHLIAACLVANLGAGVVATASLADDMVGPATVFDGDTIEVGGRTVSLYGIDAPELDQTCDKAGKAYRCGQQALQVLIEALGEAPVVCERKGPDEPDRPVLAVCRLNGVDIGGWLVAQGMALAYRKMTLDYVEHEEQARRFRKGLWGGGFTLPWVWRGETP